MNILFDNRQNEIEIDENIIELIKKSILEVIKSEKLDENIMVSVSFVDDEEIQELNKNFRGVDSSTDVLSFPIDDEFQIEERILGDVVINTKRVIEQAQEFRHSNEREMSYLTVHSVLHLLGYDHIEEEDRLIMRSKEKIIMDNLKIYR
ncbi:rRNA maturation RNase YbeY [Peptoniphilus sp. oral taxon 386]|uniref:rRNA maturation RNase YbeY n=1 Tax=Peptoniphilus sp. oral taxon 386 TaxID=652713 RepID=UPI0001DA9BCC|nr:rRNA maturation RNase YbeY [Peptoniphilus sp. oral taxon 386]EFI42382.1 translation metalloprotein YbeY [Peptoniphilus sp. oral taxon 386 str. F0131]